MRKTPSLHQKPTITRGIRIKRQALLCLMRISLRIEYSALTLTVNTLGTCMAAQNNFGIESVPDRFLARALILQAITTCAKK